jgi:hypothetical protein
MKERTERTGNTRWRGGGDEKRANKGTRRGGGIGNGMGRWMIVAVGLGKCEGMGIGGKRLCQERGRKGLIFCCWGLRPDEEGE